MELTTRREFLKKVLEPVSEPAKDFVHGITTEGEAADFPDIFLTRRALLKGSAAAFAGSVFANIDCKFNQFKEMFPSPDKANLLTELTPEHRHIFELVAEGNRVYLPSKAHPDEQNYDIDFTAAIADAFVTDNIDTALQDISDKYTTDLSYVLSALAGFRAYFFGIPEEAYDDQLQMVSSINIVTDELLAQKCGVGAGGCSGEEITLTKSYLLPVLWHEMQHFDEGHYSDKLNENLQVEKIGPDAKLIKDHPSQAIGLQKGDQSALVSFFARPEFNADLSNYAITQSYIRSFLGEKAAADNKDYQNLGYYNGYHGELLKSLGDALSTSESDLKHNFYKSIQSHDYLGYAKTVWQLSQLSSDFTPDYLNLSEDGDNIPLIDALSISPDDLMQYGIDSDTANGIKLFAVMSAIARKNLTVLRFNQDPKIGQYDSLFMHPVALDSDMILYESYFQALNNDFPKIFDSMISNKNNAIEIKDENGRIYERDPGTIKDYVRQSIIDGKLISNMDMDAFRKASAACMYMILRTAIREKEKDKEEYNTDESFDQSLQGQYLRNHLLDAVGRNREKYKHASVNYVPNPNVSVPQNGVQNIFPPDIYTSIFEEAGTPFHKDPGYLCEIQLYSDSGPDSEQIRAWVGNSTANHNGADKPMRFLYVLKKDATNPVFEVYDISDITKFYTSLFGTIIKNAFLKTSFDWDFSPNLFLDYEKNYEDVQMFQALANNEEITGQYLPYLLNIATYMESNILQSLVDMLNVRRIITSPDTYEIFQSSATNIHGHDDYSNFIEQLRKKILSSDIPYGLRNIYSMIWLYTLSYVMSEVKSYEQHNHQFTDQNGVTHSFAEYIANPSNFADTPIETIMTTCITN